MWPFRHLSVVFFVLEVVTLVSSTGERQVLPALKDAVFVVIYAVLLIVAIEVQCLKAPARGRRAAAPLPLAT